MINTLKQGKILNPRPARRYKGTCDVCEGEYSCTRDDIIVGTTHFLRAQFVGEIDCHNTTCNERVTMVKERFPK